MRPNCQVTSGTRSKQQAGSNQCGILNLHQDVQTCGYQDVQVMWNMLSSEKEAVGTGAGGTLPKPRKRPFWRLPLWPVRPPTRNAAQRD
ncbi:hypothetical protein GQ55_4G060800 [Panicum hallii var. hallii]|uniref:Uncharacterized protein n=1 Tax=Panicum hallii var. hallii TaxID=1504633 RepID=A0A2T7DVR3_9POAL|nr:hypothetical protein GQ55_4G060800 [Panicum hallii var. hallii]